MFQDVIKQNNKKLEELKKVLVMDSKGTSQIKLTPTSRKQIEELINETSDKISRFEQMINKT